jgi:glutaredoxin
MDQYGIDPAPLVIELDEHERGEELQELLAAKTQRKTVPNVIVGGHSIGGGDEIEILHENGELIETIQKYGGKRILEIKLLESKLEPMDDD